MIQLLQKSVRVLFFAIFFAFNLFAQSKSLEFNSAGTNDIVKSVNFSQIGNVYTIEGWVKISTNSGEQHLFELWDGNSGDQFYLSDGGYLNAPAISNGSDAGYSAREVSVNVWTHIAYVRSEDSLIIYKNGVRVMWGEPGGVGVQKTLVLAHFQENGNSYSTTALKGLMDEVRVWSTARTQIEIGDNKDAILDGIEPNLEALYDFDGENGNTLTDRTPNHRNGVLSNMDNSAWKTDGVTMQWYSKDDGVKTYYVSADGDDSPLRGTSEATPWRTIQYASIRVINPGDYVYVKAGVYKNENIIISDGNVANQIVFEGYKFAPGDVDNIDWWSYDENQSNLDATELPLLSGKARKEGIAIQLKPYTTFKNFQIKNYQTCVLLYDATNCDIENIIAFAIGDSTLGAQPDGDGIKIRGSAYGNGSNTIKNCKIVNAHGYGISINYSSNNIVKNCNVYSDDPYGTHYFIHIGSEDNTSKPSNNNIVDGCFLQRKVGSTHVGHGVAIKGGHDYNNGDTNGACKNNVIKNCTTKNFRGDAFAARRSGAINNEFINCIADAGTEPDASGFFARDGANNNEFKNCKTIGAATAVSFWANGEDQNKPTTAHNNTFENCIFSKTTGNQIVFGDAAYPQTTHDNSFVNCVFDGGNNLFNAVTSSTADSMINCIVTNVTNYKTGGASLSFNFKNSDFYNNGFATPSGTNLLSSNPLFVDIANADYHLQSGSPCIDAGTSSGITLPSTDYDGNTRLQGAAVDMGVYETAPTTTNYALRFNSETTKDEFVGISSIPTSGTVTIEFWVKLEGSNDDTDVMINMGGDGKRLTLKSSSHLPAWTDGWNAYSETAGISLNTWHHIAYVASSGTLTALYIDGVSQTIGGGTSLSMPTSTWYLASWYGGGSSSLNLVGCIDELRLWNDARTATEISSNKDSELNGNESGLVGYWKFNEGSGTALADSKGSADGVLYNMESSDWVSGPDLGGGSPPANNPPVANAGADQTVTDNDNNGSESVTLNGSASTDSDGTISSYVWKEGGTQIATGVNPTISLSVGTHTITLTVTDNDGATANDNVIITVNASGGGSNYALRFNSETTKDEFVSISSIPTSGMVTIEFWIKLEGSNDDTDVMINMGGDGKRLTLKSGSHLPAWTDGWNAYSETAGISLNTWHHIAYVVSSGTLTALYIDGVSQTIGGGTSVSMPSGTWCLASWYGEGASSLNLVGCLDELRLWNDVRSQSEIQSNKDQELVGNEQGLVGYWKFNEGSGTALADSKGSADGVLYNMESADWISGASSLSKKGNMKNHRDIEIPNKFVLEQNYPNPFNPTTVIKFRLPESRFVNVSVYNMIGEKIAELVNGTVEAGTHTVNFDASNLTSGIYFYRVSAGSFNAVKKMVLLK